MFCFYFIFIAEALVPQFSDGMFSYELVQNCFCDSETKRWHPIARVVWFIVKKKKIVNWGSDAVSELLAMQYFVLQEKGKNVIIINKQLLVLWSLKVALNRL